jgi:multiple antibiotic resistance protein
MEFNYGHAVTIFVGFFAMMNPFITTPEFLGLTGSLERGVRMQIARRGLMMAFVVVISFLAAGSLIFDAFGITLPAFRIAGGLLVFVVGFQMVHGEPSSVQQPVKSGASKGPESALGMAISPLALPMLAGPGTITTAINFGSTGGMSEFIVTVAAFSLLCLIHYASFASGERLIGFIGENGIQVITRLMGLILAVIGTQMVIEGIGGAFPAIATAAS